jgi:capsular exopolysaccharide synthesis family protein
VIGAYYANFTIEPIRNTQLVKLHFESEDPALAASVANSHAGAYIQSMFDARVAVTESAAAWMSERLAGMQDNLLESEQRLQAFREQEQLIDVEGLKSLPAREINELTSRLLEVRRELSQARIAYTQVYQGQDAPLEDLRGIPGILDDEGVQELRKAESQTQRKVAELAKRYGPEHTKMIAAQSELSKATENLRNQRRSVAEAIRKKFEAAQAEETELVKALDRAKQQYQEIGRKESELVALQLEADTNRKLFDLFYNRISETNATGNLESAPARIISPAVIPTKPYKPKKLLAIFQVSVLSLIVGVMAVFFLESLNNTIRSASEVEKRLKAPLLGTLPLLKGEHWRHGSLGRVFFDATEPGFNEAIRTIRTGISLHGLGNSHKVILVTSSIAEEGKSTAALNLAYAFAQMENVLLIDADMRHPVIGRELELPRDKPGFSDLLAGEATLPECVVHRELEKLDFISTGTIPPDPLRFLSSDRLASAFKVLRQKYDRIIVDSPPILPVSDALMLSTHADSVVFMIKSDATSVQQVRNGLEQLRRVDAPITGVVLNQLDLRKAEKYGDYGYEGYADYYAPRPTET